MATTFFRMIPCLRKILEGPGAMKYLGIEAFNIRTSESLTFGQSHQFNPLFERNMPPKSFLASKHGSNSRYLRPVNTTPLMAMPMGSVRPGVPYPRSVNLFQPGGTRTPLKWVIEVDPSCEEPCWISLLDRHLHRERMEKERKEKMARRNEEKDE